MGSANLDATSSVLYRQDEATLACIGRLVPPATALETPLRHWSMIRLVALVFKSSGMHLSLAELNKRQQSRR